MIGAVREWLSAVVAVAMLLTVAQALTPEGTIRKIASFTGGMHKTINVMIPSAPIYPMQ